jgi:hypothetical protein
MPATDAWGLPMSVFGEAAWNRVADVLTRILCVAAIAGGIYVALQAFGLSKDAATWWGIIAVLVMAAAVPVLGVLMLGALVVAGGFLAIGFAISFINSNPPSLYSLAVVGLFLLAGILWQLTKIANKR